MTEASINPSDYMCRQCGDPCFAGDLCRNCILQGELSTAKARLKVALNGADGSSLTDTAEMAARKIENQRTRLRELEAENAELRAKVALVEGMPAHLERNGKVLDQVRLTVTDNPVEWRVFSWNRSCSKGYATPWEALQAAKEQE